MKSGDISVTRRDSAECEWDERVNLKSDIRGVLPAKYIYVYAIDLANFFLTRYAIFNSFFFYLYRNILNSAANKRYTITRLIRGETR